LCVAHNEGHGWSRIRSLCQLKYQAVSGGKPLSTGIGKRGEMV